MSTTVSILQPIKSHYVSFIEWRYGGTIGLAVITYDATDFSIVAALEDPHDQLYN